MAPRQRRKSAWLNAPADRPPFIIRELIDDPQNNNNDAKHSSSLFNIIVEAMKQTFLPEGFPSSTPPDYLPFQAWDTLQAICSYVRGMLCSAAVMRGVGVGSDQATAYGAVFMFAVRDLTGMLGGLGELTIGLPADISLSDQPQFISHLVASLPCIRSSRTIYLLS